jgi:hypothetical protein
MSELEMSGAAAVLAENPGAVPRTEFGNRGWNCPKCGDYRLEFEPDCHHCGVPRPPDQVAVATLELADFLRRAAWGRDRKKHPKGFSQVSGFVKRVLSNGTAEALRCRMAHLALASSHGWRRTDRSEVERLAREDLAGARRIILPQVPAVVPWVKGSGEDASRLVAARPQTPAEVVEGLDWFHRVYDIQTGERRI